MRLVTVSALAVAAAAVAIGAGGLVVAQEKVGHHDFMRKHVEERIDAALDAAKATPEQKASIAKSKERVFASMESSHAARKADLQKLLELFQADKIDAVQLTALRGKHEAAMKADGDAITQALIETHDALKPDQRRALAANFREHKMEPPKGAAEWMHKRAQGRVNDALDAVKATEVQKVAIENALEQVWNAIRDEHQASHGHLEQALTLFEADRIDQAQVTKLRAEGQARHQKIGDAVIQAFHDVHDALNATQRKQLVDWVRANHPHFGG
jgi:Spy/CpxP family protein refolding chaperone